MKKKKKVETDPWVSLSWYNLFPPASGESVNTISHTAMIK